MKKSVIKYFLAANSGEGFISKFGSCYNPIDGWKAYIIKGGPGTGKSSFMKYIVKKADEKNIKYIMSPCSSDPHSLDAVIFPELKAVIMDGTSPHTVEPILPGLSDSILNFGEFWDDSLLENKEIIKLTQKNKALHRTASQYIQTAGKLTQENYNTALSFTDIKKATFFAEKMYKRYIPPKKGDSFEWEYYLSGITPDGIVNLYDTPLIVCKTLIIVKDSYGVVSNTIMQTLKKKLKLGGYEFISLANPILPSEITDHIIIPELSLGFIREDSFASIPTDKRRIRMERFSDQAGISSVKDKLKYNSLMCESLLNKASETLKHAKFVHDELEKHYINAMDFEKLQKFADKFAKKLFK